MLVRLIITLCLASVVAGCGNAPQRSSVLEESTRAPYRLSGGDKLRIIVFGQDNLSNIYTVDGAGRIAFPLIGTVQMGGMTTQELERALEARLRQGFLREPKVAAEVETYRPFFILGEVTNSGQFAFVNGMTAQTAVAIAGGFSPRANQNSVEITRMVDGSPVTTLVSVTQPLRPGDTVVIKERWF
jgi:polysaccharide biosynthesis/export protein